MAFYTAFGSVVKAETFTWTATHRFEISFCAGLPAAITRKCALETVGIMIYLEQKSPKSFTLLSDESSSNECTFRYTVLVILPHAAHLLVVILTFRASPWLKVPPVMLGVDIYLSV